MYGVLPADALVVLQKSRPDLFVVPWSKVPPNLLSQSGNLFYSELLGPYMIQKREAKLKPGFRSSPLLPKVLCIIDISGSVSDAEMKYFFHEIDGIDQVGADVYVLQADTHPSLFYKYNGESTRSAAGGTAFDPPLQWVNDAKNGVETRVLPGGLVSNAMVQEEVRMRFDGVIYLTDGYAATPTVLPYCKMLWILTPNGSDDAIKQNPKAGKIIKLHNI